MVTDAGGIKIPDVWPDVQTVITTRLPKTHTHRENSASHDVQPKKIEQILSAKLAIDLRKDRNRDQN